MTQVIVTTHEELENLIQTSVRKALNQQQAPAAQDKLLSVDEAAEFLNLARQTLYGFTSKRLVPFIKRGKKLYFRRLELEKWLSEGKRKSISEIAAEL